MICTKCTYVQVLQEWTQELHYSFPVDFRQAVFTLLLCHARLSAHALESSDAGVSLGVLPHDTLLCIIEQLAVVW